MEVGTILHQPLLTDELAQASSRGPDRPRPQPRLQCRHGGRPACLQFCNPHPRPRETER